jgi:serine/threonine-protein kinase
MATLDELNAGLAGHYAVEREIGAGGMATVYLARDVRHERQVAIKVLREDLSASLGKERFLREIKVAAALQHPHVLPLFDSGDANGLLFYVMPFVDGMSLRDRLVKEGELPVTDAARILRDVADALSEAHKHGVVHRDLKPENVMLRGRHALVTDFGVAKALSEATGRNSLTSVGIALGTPTYMAPEQAVADPHVDQRADIYAFGVMAYELLTGRPPFTGMTPQQVLAAHVTSVVEPVTARRPSIPPILATLIMKCLEKKPADRWQSADELVPMLESVLTPSGGLTPTETRPLTAAAIPAPPPAPRAKSRVPAIAAAAVVLLLAAGAWLWKSRSPGAVASDKSIAVLPFEDISGDTANRAFILGMHGEIVTQMTKLPGVQVASRQSSSGYLGSRKTSQTIAKELGVSRILTGTLQRAGGQVHVQAALEDASNGHELWAESYNQELTTANLFAIEGEVARRVAAALSVTLSDAAVAEISRPPTRSLDALDLYHRGELAWIDRGSPKRDSLSVRLLSEAVALDSGFAQAWALFSRANSWLLREGLSFDTLPARRALDRALALAPQSIDTRIASAYYAYYASGDYAGALAAFRDAERSSPKSAELGNASGLLLRRLGRFDEALAAMLQARDVDPRDVSTRQNLADLYFILGRFDEAGQAADEVLRINPTSLSGLSYQFAARLAKGDTSGAVAAVARQRGSLDARDLAWFDAELALWRHDLAGAIAGFRASEYGFANADGNISGDPTESKFAAYAVIARLSGDRSAARRFADSAVAAGAMVRQSAERRPRDAFGIGATADMSSALALAAAGESARAVALGESALARYNTKNDAMEGSSMNRTMAIVYELAGRPHDAVAQLKIALGVPVTVTIAELRSSAVWEPLRNDAEFKALVGIR